MAVFNKYGVVAGNQWLAKYNLASDAIKVMLTNTAPVPLTDVTYTGISGGEVANGNGYVTGGNALTLVSANPSTASGLFKAIYTGYTITATGAIGPFRYLCIYDNTATNKDLLGYYDIGTVVNMISGDTLQLVLDATNGMIQDS
jgi:hypothetical protein